MLVDIWSAKNTLYNYCCSCFVLCFVIGVGVLLCIYFIVYPLISNLHR